MAKKRRRKQSDSDYRGADCEDVAKLVHGHKKPAKKLQPVNRPAPAEKAKKQDNDNLQVEEKPLQMIFKSGKSRKRLVYFKYPDELTLVKANDEELQSLNTLLDEFLRANPEFQLSSSKRKSRHAKKKGQSTKKPPNKDQDMIKVDSAVESHPAGQQEQKTEEPKPKERQDCPSFKRFLVFGFNQMFRLTQTNQLAMILLLDPLTTHLQNTVLQIAFRHNTPVLLVSSLNHAADLFRVSTVSCMGVMKCAGQEDSPLKNFHDQVLRLYLEIRGRHATIVPALNATIPEKQAKKAFYEKTFKEDGKAPTMKTTTAQVESKSKNKPKRIRFHIPCPEFMYILKKPKRLETDQHAVLQAALFENGELGLFTSISSSNDEYFPKRRTLNNALA